MIVIPQEASDCSVITWLRKMESWDDRVRNLRILPYVYRQHGVIVIIAELCTLTQSCLFVPRPQRSAPSNRPRSSRQPRPGAKPRRWWGTWDLWPTPCPSSRSSSPQLLPPPKRPVGKAGKTRRECQSIVSSWLSHFFISLQISQANRCLLCVCLFAHYYLCNLMRHPLSKLLSTCRFNWLIELLYDWINTDLLGQESSQNTLFLTR